jgi:hypothetical protein
MYVISNEKGQPVAVSATRAGAESFAYRNACRDLAAPVEWSGTGKMMIDSRWNGWECREVIRVRSRRGGVD